MVNPCGIGLIAIPSVGKSSEKLSYEYRPASTLMQTVFQREDSAICRGSVGLAREIEAFCSSLVVQKCYTQDQSLSFVEVGRRGRSLVAGDGLDRKRTPDTIEPHLAWLLPDLLLAARSFTASQPFLLA